MRRSMPETRSSGRAPRARTHRRKTSGGVGLALAGGGPLGGIYEVGALLALADSLDGIDFTKLDAYVGVSSGGFVAAALANGISPAQMYRLFIDDGDEAAMKPEIFLRPAPSRRARVVLHPGARDSDRRLRQSRDRELPLPPVRGAGTHQRLPQAS